MKIVSPKYDICGKELFQNELVRKHFISDVLKIPVNQIHSVRFANTFLRKRYRRQKLGILDILLEMNNDCLINIEIQLKQSIFWDKRQLFYLSRLYSSELRTGENYSRLKRCVSIGILDFNLTDDSEYHNIYNLRNESCRIFSNEIEVHTLELRKSLSGENPLDDWIRLFNAESEDDLNMIKTKNTGILEAIREVKIFNFSRYMRLRYEAHMKYIRDKKAIEAYELYQRENARIEGIRKGFEEGMAKGREAGILEGYKDGILEGREAGILEGHKAGILEGREAGILEGHKAGILEGVRQVVKIYIEDNLEDGKTKSQITEKLITKFQLSKDEANELYRQISQVYAKSRITSSVPIPANDSLDKQD